MTKIFTYFFILLFTIQICEQALIVGHFIINQNFYAAICENKDQPELECNGKCHLKKQLKKQEEKQSEKEKISLTKENLNFIASCFDLLPGPKISTNKHHILLPDYQHPKNHISDIFHPPKNS